MVLDHWCELINDAAGQMFSHAGRQTREIRGRRLQVVMGGVDCVGCIDAYDQHRAGGG